MARPKKAIDAEQVLRLACVGCPPEEIAAELDTTEQLIKRRFMPVVKKGHQKGKRMVRSLLFKQASQGNTAALIFLSKAWLGMKEQPDVAINVSATATGGTIVFSDEQKKELTRMARIIRHQVFAETTGGSGNGSNGDPASN